jgi:uncharacterized protein
VGYILERDLPFSLNYYRDNACSTHIRDLQFEEQQMIDAMRSVFDFIAHHLPNRSLLSSLVDKASLNTLHRRTCGVGHNYLVIDQDGGVTKCQVDMQATLTTIDADDPLGIIRSDHRGVQGHRVEEKQGCRTCDWRYWCTGGCPMLTYKMTGRSDVQSPNCGIYKALIPEALRLEGLRLLRYVPPVVL